MSEEADVPRRGGGGGGTPQNPRPRGEGRHRQRILQLAAERICALILNPDYPRIDIEIERQALRETCARLFPDRLGLFDLIYESRFDRLLDQWRQPEEDEFPEAPAGSDWA